MTFDPIALIAALALAGALFALAHAATYALGARHRETASRLREIAGGDVPTPGSSGERRRVAAPSASSISITVRLQRHLRRAGLAWQPRDLVLLMLLCGMSVGALAGGLTGIPVLGLVAGMLAGALPLLVVQRRVARRAARLSEQVVDAVDLVASSLRSGFGFVQCLEVAAREQDDPIAGELRQVIREVNLGRGVDEALERLVHRTGDADLELVVGAVLIQRRVGGDLAEVLTNIANTIRDRIRVRGEVRTLTAQMRMSAWIVGLLPLALAGIMTVMQPQHMSVLITDPTGRMLTVVAIGMQLVGFFLVRRTAHIDY